MNDFDHRRQQNQSGSSKLKSEQSIDRVRAKGFQNYSYIPYWSLLN
jgi:hypothetical protein